MAEAIAELKLSYAVLTSVSRDDLPDGGAEHYARTIEAVRRRCPAVGIEVLIPDYLGSDLRLVMEARPDVLAHNLEVVRGLTESVRDRRSSYDRSLEVLARARELDSAREVKTKSSLLLGLGERDDQIESALDDLRASRVDLLCLGQYLQPTGRQLPVQRYVTPARFDELADLARSKGFEHVASGPLVRTSYHAAELLAGGTPPETNGPSMKASELRLLRPGRLPYDVGLLWQERLERLRLADEIPDTVILLEHPPVLTIGHRGEEANVVAEASLLHKLGIEVHRTSRGGDVTYHGPGQIVVYPIVHLDQSRLSVAQFVSLLEETMIRTVAEHGVDARRMPNRPGIFVGNDKIGAVGIHVSRGVTTHGLALNVDPDLSHFDLIVPCGLRHHGVTSLRRAAGRGVDETEVQKALVKNLANLMDRELVELDRPPWERE